MRITPSTYSWDSVAFVLKHVLTFKLIVVLIFSYAQDHTSVRLFDPDPELGSCYGCSVAIHDDYVFVGEPDPGGQGRVHVFERNSGGFNAWGWVQTILPPETTAGQGISLGEEFGHVCIAAGDLVVLRPLARIHLDQLDTWVCSDHSILRYRRGSDGVWTLNSEQGGALMPDGRCGVTGSWSLHMAASDLVFARSQYNLEVYIGQFNIPDAVPGVTASDLVAIEEEPIHLFWGSTQLLAVVGDTVITDDLRFRTIYPPEVVDSIALHLLVPGIEFDDMNPISAYGGMLAVGYPDDDSLGVDAGSILLFDIRSSPPLFVGRLFDSFPAEGGRFGTDVEMKGVFLAVLRQESMQQGTVDFYERCADQGGWCWRTRLLLPDPTPILPDAFRMSTAGEFVVSTESGVYIYYDQGAGVGVETMGRDPRTLSLTHRGSGALVIEVPDAMHTGRLYIVDTFGRVVMDKVIGAGDIEIPCARFASGLYMVRCVKDGTEAIAKFMNP